MSTKTQNKKQITEESVEAKPHASTEVTTITDEAKKAMRDSWEQLFGGTADTISSQLFGSAGELHEGQAVSLQKQAQQKEEEKAEKKVVTSEHMEYFRTVQNADRIGESRTENEMKQAVDEIRMEIKRLVQSSKIVERTVKDATADKAPIKPGKYHINFFRFILSVLRDATSKIEDGASLGAVFASKKQQSKYWNSYKKHGTSFGLSGERSTATQTG